jgi:5'(3')-deoxyribonucleotidase
MKTLYLDMDGVVADFNGYAEKLLGYRAYEERWEEHEWQLISQNSRIYRDLNKTVEADFLVKYCMDLVVEKNWELKFLTAVPRNNDLAWAFTDKITWGRKHFPYIPVMFGPYSKDKWQHCTPGDILIDDRTSNIEEWTAAGGIGILHKGDIDSTIASLATNR